MKKLIRNAKRNLEKKLASEKNNKRPFYAYVKGKTKSRQTVGPLRKKDSSFGTCTAKKTLYQDHQSG